GPGTARGTNGNGVALRAVVEQTRPLTREGGGRAARELLREVRAARPLVKYADPNPYEIETRRDLRQAASELMKAAKLESVDPVDLLDEDPLELELATTLLYQHCHYSYRQLRNQLEAMGGKLQREIVDLGLRHRGRQDEMLRASGAGQKFRSDILMDVGGFRDMHRHRRCVQIGQSFTTLHGYEVPEEYEAAGARKEYDATMRRAAVAVEQLSGSPAAEAPENAQYAIPLAYRKRTLFKMDFAEAVYISELRTTPAGHASYRNLASGMYEPLPRNYP